MSPQLQYWKSQGAYFSYRHLRVFFRTDGQGEALLILHGYPFNSYDFKDLWPELTKRFYVVAPDMPGMGFSDKPADYSYAFEDHAEMYTALLQHLKVHRVHLLAHDLGNSVAQELLARQEAHNLPFEIASIAFLNGGLFTDVYQPRLIQILLSKSPPPVGKLISRMISARSVARATAEVFGPNTKPTPELQHDFWQILNYNDGKSLAWKIGRLVFTKEAHQTRWIGAMQQTNVPMCFINGPADPNSGLHMAMRYRELIPQPKVYLLSATIGHWPQLEAPDEVIQHLNRFYAKPGS